MNQPPQNSGDQPSGNQPSGNQSQPPGNFPPPPGNFPPPPGSFPPPPGNYGPPQGNFPPPPGNYPPPPGNFPPPPGNYGPPQGSFPPPPGYYPPPAPGYPAPGGSSMSIGDGLSWAFKQLGKNIGPLLVSTLVYGIIIGLLSGALYGALMAVSPNTVTYYSESSSYFYSGNMVMGPVGTLISLVGNLVIVAVGGVLLSAYLGGLLDIADGRPVSIGSFFKPRMVGSMVIATLIMGVLTSIGSFLCVIPGLLVSIFTMFTTVALLDRNLSPVDALKASFEIVKAKFIDCLLVWLVAIAIIAVGALLCGVGLLVAIPVAFLFEIFAFRRITGGNVVPAV